MTTLARIPARQRLVLDDISWQTYERLLRSFEDRRLRLTYDDGRLEIMTLSFEHERFGRFLGRLVLIWTEEFSLPLADGGSVTIRRRKKAKGLEADDCFWIENEALVRGKKTIDLRFDPPPDLAIETDITRSCLNRMRIYAALKVPEVWRFDGKVLEFHVLQENGKYVIEPESRMFPELKSADLLPFLAMVDKFDSTEVSRRFRSWVRKRFKKGSGNGAIG